MIIQQAKDMRMGLIVNNKGQITDQAKFNEAMFALMDSKFKGGMEKQAQTMKGLWSTVTGTTKNALAEIVGITADGTIKQGSLFENVKIAITGIITKLNEWSADGTFQDIATKTTDIIGGMTTAITEIVGFIKEYKDELVILAGGIAAYYIAAGIANGVMFIQQTYMKFIVGYAWAMNAANGQLTVSQYLLNTALSANPIGMVVLGITAIVVALVLAYKKSETFRMYVDAAWATIKEFGAEIMKLPERIKQMWGNGIEKVKEFWGKIQELWFAINQNPFAKFALDILALADPITAIMRHFDKLKEGWNWIKDKVGLGDDKNTTTPKTTTTKTTATKPLGSHRTGESFVKNDGMYKLHYGERVLTKAENSQYSQGGASSSPSINISINAVQELGNEIKRAIQPIVETTIKNYQTKQLMKMGIAGGQ